MSKVQSILTLEELDAIIADSDKVVVSFGAPSWCVPCQRLAPHMAAASEQMAGVPFVEVDIEKCEGPLLARFTIKSVPTVLLFTNGVAKPVVARTAPLIVNEVKNA